MAPMVAVINAARTNTIGTRRVLVKILFLSLTLLGFAYLGVLPRS